MHTNTQTQKGHRALYCLDERTILWFVLGLVYMTYHLHVSSFFISEKALMEIMCVFFMIGATFWAGQSYGYNAYVSKLLTTFFGIFVAISLYTLNAHEVLLHAYQNYNFLPSISLDVSLGILATLLLYCILALLYALTEGTKTLASVVPGLLVLSLLSVCYLTLEPSSKNYALWISGWGLFSVFWIRSYKAESKKYVLYQCQ